jgi:hypothetical protein
MPVLEAVNRVVPKNLLILMQSLIVAAPGARENRGLKSAQSNGGLADENRFLCHYRGHG